MRVLISNDDGLDTLLQAEEMEQAVACMLEAEGADPSSDVEVSISFVRSAEMRSLNASWRGIDAPTDVLSNATGSTARGSKIPSSWGTSSFAPRSLPRRLRISAIRPLRSAGSCWCTGCFTLWGMTI